MMVRGDGDDGDDDDDDDDYGNGGVAGGGEDKHLQVEEKEAFMMDIISVNEFYPQPTNTRFSELNPQDKEE